MNRNTRYWMRRILFLVMLGLIGYALYQTVTQAEKNRLEAEENAPNFELSTLDGKNIKLSDYKGKAVLLNFWGSWCEPCRTEMPALQDVYEKYHTDGFVVLSVNIAETDVAVSSFASQYGLTFPVLMDRNRDITRLYHVGPIPSTFFIDKDGRISKKVEGPLHLNQLRRYILSDLVKNDPGAKTGASQKLSK